jgi:hypothetical protein
LRYGHLLPPRGFSWQCEIENFGTINFPRHHGPALRRDGFAYPFSLTAWTRTSDRAILYPPASPHRTNGIRWYRNFNLLSIAYAFRPRLRSRLTLSGRTFLRKPEAFGGGDSHPSFRYSYRQSHFQALHRISRCSFAALGTLPYHVRRTSTASVDRLAPLHFRRRVT